ncbi:hypothetical protein KC921_00670, partial [Candidatus Woesebacteria bacterium]|nr:hypothetical protein [Candidatus Woesebacteria bacterium]
MKKSVSVPLLKQFLLLGLLVSVLFFGFATPAQAQTHAWSGVCLGGPDRDVATIQGLECLIANVFTVTLTLIGLGGFVMFIVGAFKWLTAGSNSKNLDSAKKTFTFAVLGLVLALSAFIIINLIADFTGVSVIKTFRIPTSDINW